MRTYKKGSRGSEVRQIQAALGVETDGIFGSKTEQAVRDYQRQNGLKVDGIVGTDTWGSLFSPATEYGPPDTGGGSGTGSGFYWGSSPGGSMPGNYGRQQRNADWLAQYEGRRPSYAPSQAVNDAAAMLAGYERSRPKDYTSPYGDKIQAILNQMLNREPFQYDFNADPLYQQYKDQYVQNGKLAMMDTMGMAAALSGGYGNSYAAGAGQQAYQGYLQQLNNVIPELRSAAYDAWLREGDETRSNLGVLQGLDESDYARYRHGVSDYYNDLNYYYNKYNDISEADYRRYLNDLSAWQADRAYYYGKHQDEQAQANWQAQFGLSQAAKEAAGRSGSSGTGSTGSSGGTGGGGYNNGALTTKQVKQLQTYLGVTADGKWGSKSRKAAHGLGADAAWEKYKGELGSSPATSRASSNALSESEFNRSPAMQAQYGTYRNYLLKSEIDGALKNGNPRSDLAAWLDDPDNDDISNADKTAALDYLARTADVLTESEFNRSPAMQAQYGTYRNYLNHFRF